MRALLLGLLGINVATFVAFGLDKWKARTGRWRIPESTLWILTAAGGAPAAWLAMSRFRHKTRKTSFRLKIVLATLLNLLWVWLWFRYGSRGGGGS
jgi:uncharacterized membrane protein YsdA (DUF1294 family)